MNKERQGAARNARPYSPDAGAKPVSPLPPQASTTAPAGRLAPPDAEQFIVGIHALEALSAKYLTPAKDGDYEVLRRVVAPGDQATLRPLIATSERFLAAHPAGHALWRPLLQQLARQGGPSNFRGVVAAVERSKPLLVEYRMERIATMAKRLSHVIEMFPQRPFADALRQLTAAEQSIYNQSVARREWSDLFLTPLAQQVLQASRPAPHTPPHGASVAAARRGRSASYAAKQARPAGPPPPQRNRPRERGER